MKLLIVSGHRRFAKWRPLIRRTANFLERRLKQPDSYVEVYLVGKKFMNKNVLAFPAPKGFPYPNTKLKPLGEIYLNPDFIAKDPLYPNLSGIKLRAPSSELRAKVSYLFIHGFLHLLGYDHKKRNDRIKMEKKEKELLSELLII